MKRIAALLVSAMLMAGLMACISGGISSDGPILTIGVEEFAEVVKQKDVRLIDVRTPKEYAEGHLPGAENIDVNGAGFAEKIKGVDGKVAVYCRSGRRSLNAAKRFAAQGCTVYDLKGGIMAWQQAGKPTTK